MNWAARVSHAAVRAVKGQKTLRTGALLLTDWGSRVALGTGLGASESGSTHRSIDVDRSVDYVQEVFQDYKRFAGFERFSGRVAEVGPGDSSAVALEILADGAEAIDLVDRFRSWRDEAQQRRILARLAERDPAVRARFGPEPDDTAVPELRVHHGPEAAAERFFARGEIYDFIVSRAVFEHMDDPLAALRAMAQALRPGGRMIHEIDLHDHGLYTPEFGELHWLGTPRRVHRALSRGSGRPNRILTHRYREALQEVGLPYRLGALGVVGSKVRLDPRVPFDALEADVRARARALIAEARPRLAREFRGVADADLAVNVLLVVVERPA